MGYSQTLHELHKFGLLTLQKKRKQSKRVGEYCGELRGSRLEACQRHNFYLYTNQPGNSVCIGKDTSKQNKYKQQQLSNNYSNHVVYLWVTIIHDKMINNQAHKSCA